MTLPNQALVLFQGDSITNAFRKPEEICDAYQMGAGYALMVAAHLKAAHPRAALRFCNRGVSGDGLPELAARWEPDCLQLCPDVLSILCGVNATIRKFTDGSDRPDIPLSGYTRLYRELLSTTRDALPHVKLMVCEPFLLPCGVVTSHWMEDIRGRGRIAQQLAQEFDAVFVSLQDIFDAACEEAPPEYWAFDGIHPTAAGHFRLAQAWLGAIGEK